ncbi:MAG: 5-formyltetrahydrofolate cyclo-ligase [Xanthomonadales bacterium]|nr:5-formyltetrahydrofolate cyclo-ligase [Xanthomonadales bacterium]
MKTKSPSHHSSPIQSIRLNLRAARKSLASDQREVFNYHIQQQVKTWVKHSKPASIGLFRPFDGEPDLLPIVAWLRSRGVQLALPVIDSSQAGIMQFHLWAENTQLQVNRFGIEEPLETIQIVRPEVIFAPLVAFSSNGTRLGMGSGYYDRYLEKPQSRPRIAGIAYELQRIENLPQQEWDIPLDMIFTEKGRFSFAKQGQ